MALIDLVRYDELRIKDTAQEKQLINSSEIINRLSIEVKERTLAYERLSEINKNQSEIISLSDQKYKSLERKYITSVRVGRLKVVLLVGAIVGGGYLILKK